MTVILSCLFYIVHDNRYFTKTPTPSYHSNFSAVHDDARPGYKNKNPLTCLYNTAHPINQTKKEWKQCLDPGKKPEYYLSIVLVTRMDDYAGNQHHRFQNLIDSTYLLAEQSQQKIELLIIEWNPPVNKRRILDTFRFRGSKYLNHRIITVSKEIHQRVPNIGNAPLHEFEGKNVGIRFARGEYIVCTNQDDIWSHNFMNAVKSKVFEKDTIYTQFQSPHNIHENLPPSIVNLAPFPDDETLYNACKLSDQDWGNYNLPPAVPSSIISHENYWYYGDQAGDFTMAHRDTWKDCRGYRETGGVAWMDIEFILSAIGQFKKQLVYSGDTFACHQEHPNEWEKTPDRHTKPQDAQGIDDLITGKKKLSNKEGHWGLQQIDIWKYGLECHDFHGGLCL
ncbi:uncharacterized protein EV154DRAFT_455698 [Mucor mucedo]|uniref:uncharacterized protein n=1 Tax=Mucor mucedo TaxID=29922 RepID=UPI002220A44A|nr:uncharacterized protein EV154DRAFT_455698 [Mucor mucedo]KAI7896532.1 hypothetical protein EV154DRAFT_455698 [Mucor mucedo]